METAAFQSGHARDDDDANDDGDKSTTSFSILQCGIQQHHLVICM